MTRELTFEKSYSGELWHLVNAMWWKFSRIGSLFISLQKTNRVLTFGKLYLGRAVSFNRCDVVPVDCAVLHTLKFKKKSTPQ